MNIEQIIEKLQQFYGTGMETIETVPAVLAIVRMSNLNPIESARIAANIGGDTDTIGAVATALCSAVNSIKDQRIIGLLEKVNNIDFTELALKLIPLVNL